MPTINLHEALLVICQGQPFIAPGAGTDRIGVASASRCRIHANLSLDLAVRLDLESADITRQMEFVRSRCSEEIVRALREEDYVCTIKLFAGFRET